MNKKEVFVVILLVLALFVGALALHPQQGDVVQAQTPTTLTKVDVVFVYVPCVGKAEVSAIPAPLGAKAETIVPVQDKPVQDEAVVVPDVVPDVVDPPVVVPDTDKPAKEEKQHCDNGAGNNDDCTPGHSSGSNQGNGQQTGDQTNQGENGHNKDK